MVLTLESNSTGLEREKGKEKVPWNRSLPQKPGGQRSYLNPFPKCKPVLELELRE